jgi:hypothetical protein
MASLPDPANRNDNKSQAATTESTSPGNEVPPPPPEMCTECIHPDGHHFFATVEECQQIGGTPTGLPFPCPVTAVERQLLASKMGLRME